MKKAVQPKTVKASAFDQFENAIILSPNAQNFLKGGDGDEDTTNIIVEDVVEH